MINAFITGSRAYGSPRFDSDVDLVVLVDKTTMEELYQQSDGGRWTSEDASASLRFGSLNLIVTDDLKIFDVWRCGTEELKSRRPVTRGDAIFLLSTLREKAGIPEMSFIYGDRQLLLGHEEVVK